MTRPVIGSTGWGTALNADLDQLEGRIGDLEAPYWSGVRTATVQGMTRVLLRDGNTVTMTLVGEPPAAEDPEEGLLLIEDLLPVGARPAMGITVRLFESGEYSINAFLNAGSGDLYADTGMPSFFNFTVSFPTADAEVDPATLGTLG